MVYRLRVGSDTTARDAGCREFPGCGSSGSRPGFLELQAQAQGYRQIREEEDQDTNRHVVSEQPRVSVRSKAEPELDVGEAVLHNADRNEGPAAAEPGKEHEHDEQEARL